MKNYVLHREGFEKFLASQAPRINRRTLNRLFNRQGMPLPREVQREIVKPLNRLTLCDADLMEIGSYLSEVQTCLEGGDYDKDPLIAVYLSLLTFHAACLTGTETDHSAHYRARTMVLAQATDLDRELVAGCFVEQK